jgi:hypothetical protein
MSNSARSDSPSRFLKRIGLGIGCVTMAACAIWVFSRSSLIMDVASHECTSRIVRIRMALETYHEKYGEYPPLVVRDSDGTPLYSWRVLLTEFLNHDLYESFNLNERWDSPANQVFAKKPTGVFECPAAGASRAGFTNYFAVVEPNGDSRFDWLEYRHASLALRRGLVLVETSTLDVEWSRPIDLLSSTIQEDQLLGKRVLNCRHNHGPYGIAAGDELLKSPSGVVVVH